MTLSNVQKSLQFDGSVVFYLNFGSVWFLFVQKWLFTWKRVLFFCQRHDWRKSLIGGGA